jgi:hypothetical protein
VIGGVPAYRPWAIFLWWYHYDAYAPHVFDRAGAIAGASGFVGCGAAVGGSLWRARQRRNVITYGSAHWASPREIMAAGLFGDGGIFLGRLGERFLRHDGSSLRIDSVPATDPLGFAGLADKVDVHSWQLLKGVALSTLLGVSSQLALFGQSDLVQAIRMSTQDSVARAGDQITQRNLGIQPTITIRPEALVRLVVHKNLGLAPWGKED